jgi:hypothetical protein
MLPNVNTVDPIGGWWAICESALSGLHLPNRKRLRKDGRP